MYQSTVVESVKVESFLRRSLKGRYFGIGFYKNDGSYRVLNARLGIKSNGSGRKTIGRPSDPYLVVYSNNDQGYRAVNLKRVAWFTMNGERYRVAR